MQHKSIATFLTSRFRNSCSTETVTWNEMKFQRKIVIDYKYASNIKDQSTHFALVEASYKALPWRLRSRQSNETTVEPSCTSLDVTFDVVETLQNHKNTHESKRVQELREKTKLRNDVSRDREDEQYLKAHARTRIHAIRHGRM